MFAASHTTPVERKRVQGRCHTQEIARTRGSLRVTWKSLDKAGVQAGPLLSGGEEVLVDTVEHRKSVFLSMQGRVGTELWVP